MSTSLHQSQPNPLPVAHTVGGRVIQTIQGVYYSILGLCTALAIQTLYPGFHASYLWAVQAFGVAVAGFGIALVYSGQRQEGPFITGRFAMSVALILGVLSTVSLASGALSAVYLLDVGLEFMFACWWGFAILFISATAQNAGST